MRNDAVSRVLQEGEKVRVTGYVTLPGPGWMFTLVIRFPKCLLLMFLLSK